MFLPEYNLRIYLKNGWASEGAEAAVGQRNFSLKWRKSQINSDMPPPYQICNQTFFKNEVLRKN